MNRPTVLFIFVAAVLGPLAIGAGLAHAAGSRDTGLSWQGQSSNLCYYSQAKAVWPAADGSHVDFKAFIYKKVRNSQCSTTYTGSNFYSGESQIRATLYRASDLTICSQTSLVSTPSTSSSWGVGRTWSKSGTCGATTQYVVGADGNWQTAFGNWFDGPYTGSIAL